MKKLLWLIPVALVVINCGGGGGKIMPLAVGNEWNYRTIMTVDFVDTLFPDVADTSTMATEITAQTTLDDGTTEVFEQVTTSTVDTFVTVDTSYVLDNGDFVLAYESKTDATPDTGFAYPAEEGKTWNVNADQTAVILGTEDVTVPGGTFNDCWKVGYIMNDETTFVFIADGTGQVKWSFSDADTTMSSSSVSELTSSTIQ